MSSTNYLAARKAAVIVEQYWLGVLRLTGPDRQSWLQSMITNEVQKLKAGEGCYAAHLTAQGKLVAQMIVICAEDSLWLLVERAAVGNLAGSFERLIIMEDVQVQDMSEEYAVLALIGPRADDVAESVMGVRPKPGALYSHHLVGDMRIIKADLGYHLLVKREASEQVIKEATAARAMPIDQKTWNVVRTEAGLPMYGVDIDESTVLPELGERGISYEKGCYIGQEVIAKIKYIGHVNRKFVGFICDGTTTPEPRSVVKSGGKEVGYVTTSVMSPSLGRPIALGFVSRAASVPGTAVTLAGKEINVTAKVAQLPLVH